MRFFLSARTLKRKKRRLQALTLERVPELAQAHAERVAARMLAQHEQRFARTNALGRHDFVGLRVLEHTVLVDAGLVREGVRADDGLVRLHHHAGAQADQATGARQLRRVDAGAQAEQRRAGVQRHHDLFQRRVAGALADAVDRDLRLARAVADAGQGVGRRQTEVVVAMHRDGDVVDALHVFDDAGDHRAELFGDGVAHGVRDVERRSTRRDHRVQHLVQELGLGAAGVFRAELDVFAQRARQGHHLPRALHDLLFAHLELVLAVDGRSGQKRVDARMFGHRHGLVSRANVLLGRARQPAKWWAARWRCDPVARRCRRCARSP